MTGLTGRADPLGSMRHSLPRYNTDPPTIRDGRPGGQRRQPLSHSTLQEFLPKTPFSFRILGAPAAMASAVGGFIRMEGLSPSCFERDTPTCALEPLFMLNAKLLHEKAVAFQEDHCRGAVNLSLASRTAINHERPCWRSSTPLQPSRRSFAP